jgi:hypothetical protein
MFAEIISIVCDLHIHYVYLSIHSLPTHEIT